MWLSADEFLMDQALPGTFLQAVRVMALFLLPMLEYISSEEFPASYYERAKILVIQL
jgi:hypothetical protein